LGTFKDFFESDGYSLCILDAKDTKNILKNISHYAGIVILGGPMSVYDNYDYLKEEQNLIRKASELGVPTLGICLGSQLIAQALGGRVYQGNIKEIGWYEVEITDDGKREIFNDISSQMIKIFQWHGDTYDLPVQSKILAKSKEYTQAFRIKNAIGIQFHIEVNVNMINNWIKQYSKELKDSKIVADSILPENISQIEDLSNLCKSVYTNFHDMIQKNQEQK
jgi:GMP synthase-like glutamine amidotransferase